MGVLIFAIMQINQSIILLNVNNSFSIKEIKIMSSRPEKLFNPKYFPLKPSKTFFSYS